MVRTTGLLVVSLAAFLAAPAFADDLTGADDFVCAATVVVACLDNGDCEEGLPAELNVPQFIEVDLAAKRIRTTRASGENRSTPIATVIRRDGAIVLQGYEGGRAFSFLISEPTGDVTVAVARNGVGVTVFGACTPMLSAGRPERP